MAIIYGTSGSDIRNGDINGIPEDDTIYGYPEANTPPSKVIASDLYRPLFATAPEGDAGRLFVVSQGGAIKIHDLNNPQAAPETFLDISSKVNNNTEAGLLGFTFHPDFATNGKCYVNYTTPDRPDGTGRKQAIVEYTFNPNDLSQTPTEKTIMVIDYPQEHTHHRAGWLDFGPDGMLYIATGEDTVAANAQTVVNQDGSINHLGKILRIDVSGDGFPADENRNYRIPADNPTQFDNIAGTLPQASEIWAVGLRNPWRASFGPDGKLYVADVGQNTYEEINIVEAGRNYGWREAPVADGPQNLPGYTDPYHYYGRDIGGSVTGGYFYSGQGTLNGKYIFGDFNNGHIFAMDVGGPEPDVEDITSLFRDANGDPMQFGHLSSFGLDGQGNLYAISYADDTWGNDTGRVFRLSDNTPVADVGDELNGLGGNDTIYGGGGNDTIHGGTEDDHVYGDADDDQLYGDAGTDTLNGGAGNDVYFVDSGDTIEGEGTSGGTDEVRALESFTLQAGQAIETLRIAESDRTDAFDLMGNALSQELIGNFGSNRFVGGGGVDTLRGLLGNDTYVVDGDDVIIELANEGNDTVESTINWILGDHLENLTLLNGAVVGTGNIFNNIIVGNDVANTLNGAGGSDTLNGGDGNDTYVIDGADDAITETSGNGTDTVIANASYVLAADVDVEILRAAEGNGGINLTGNGLGNIFHGNRGASRIDGAGGDDTVRLTGKRSDYTITRNQNGFTLVDNRQNGDGTDAIFNVEIFQFSDGAVSAGNLLNPPPTQIDLNKDVVIENAKDGFEIGQFKVTDNTGDEHRFELTDTAGGRFSVDRETGMLKVADGVRLDYEQATQHTITVKVTDGAGALMTRTLVIRVQDQLDESGSGGTNADVMMGGSGRDTFTGGAGNDTLNAGEGHDRLSGDAGSDSLVGGAGNDVLSGGGDNDRLIGGLGKDTLTGSQGRDVFVFDDRETGSSKAKADYITDFSGRSGDRIDLKAVDADTKKRGDQKFSFIGDKAFTKAGQVRYEKTKKETYVYLNTDNDKAAEAVIKLKGAIDLQKGWFVL